MSETSSISSNSEDELFQKVHKSLLDKNRKSSSFWLKHFNKSFFTLSLSLSPSNNNCLTVSFFSALFSLFSVVFWRFEDFEKEEVVGIATSVISFFVWFHKLSLKKIRCFKKLPSNYIYKLDWYHKG